MTLKALKQRELEELSNENAKLRDALKAILQSIDNGGLFLNPWHYAAVKAVDLGRKAIVKEEGGQ